MENKQEETKTEEKKDWDFCFCAKFLVGVPAIFIIAYYTSIQFEGALMQVWAGAGSALLAIWIALKIDKHPALNKKIVDKD
ncbi:MAG: hypothetical protein ACN2B6_05565 [Rickettsiales bacterium]